MDSFIDRDHLVLTVDDDYLENEEDVMGSEGQSVGSERSCSDLNKQGGDLPDVVWFGEKECRCIFSLEQDKGAFQRVCGCESGSCGRPGHGVGNKAGCGFYQPVKARKFTDGILASLMSREEYHRKERERRESNSTAMAAAGAFLSGGGETEGATVGLREEGVGGVMGGGGAATTTLAAASPDMEVVSGGARAGGVKMRAGSGGTRKTNMPSASLKDDAAYTWVGEGSEGTEGNPKKRVRETEPSMQEIMKNLSSHLADLSVQVRKLSTENMTNSLLMRHVIKEAKLDREAIERAIDRVTPSVVEEEDESQVCYAVAYGKGGVQGIFDHQGEVAPLVVGVPNNQHRRCRNREEAQAYIDDFNLAKGLENAASMRKRWYVVTNTASGTVDIFRTWAEASTYTTGISCATCKRFRTLGEAEEYAALFRAENATSSESEEDYQEDQEEGKDDQDEHNVARLRGGGKKKKDVDMQEPDIIARSWKDFPPTHLLGHDQSTGQDEGMFGIQLNEGEAELRNKMTPGVLRDKHRKGMISNTIDAVSMPGMYSGVEDGGQDTSGELTILGEAMEELVNQRRQGGESVGRSDLHWRSDKRVTLGNIKNQEDLRRRVLVLGKLMPKIRGRMVTMVGNACRVGGMKDETCTHSWANHGWLTVMVTQTFLFYLGLHRHLLTGGEAHGWDFIKAELEHYVQELRLIRSTADSRFHCLCLSYALLRDGYHNKWFNVSIQQARNAYLFSSPTSRQAMDIDEVAQPPQSGLCPKCGTNFHGPTLDTCPWKNQTDENAKKNAAKTLKALGRSF